MASTNQPGFIYIHMFLYLWEGSGKEKSTINNQDIKLSCATRGNIRLKGISRDSREGACKNMNILSVSHFHYILHHPTRRSMDRWWEPSKNEESNSASSVAELTSPLLNDWLQINGLISITDSSILSFWIIIVKGSKNPWVNGTFINKIMQKRWLVLTGISSENLSSRQFIFFCREAEDDCSAQWTPSFVNLPFLYLRHTSSIGTSKYHVHREARRMAASLRIHALPEHCFAEFRSDYKRGIHRVLLLVDPS